MISYQAWQNSTSVMGFPKYSRNCRQWDLNPCRHLFMKPSLQVKQDDSSGRDETKFVGFHPRLLFLEHKCVNLAGHVETWGHKPWASGQDIPAGLATAVCSQTAWRAAEFSFMDWSINGVFLLCPDVDFHKVCGGWYLWNISTAKLVRISL